MTPKDKGGGYLTFGANGENPNIKGRTHQTINYLSCLIHPIIYHCHKLVEAVIAWEWEEYGQRNSNLWKTHFLLLGQVNTQNTCPFGDTSTFSIFPQEVKLGS